MSFDYAQKFSNFESHPAYQRLAEQHRQFIRSAAFEHRFTFQEFRQVVEVTRDLSMWGEHDLANWWQAQTSRIGVRGPALKRQLLQNLRSHADKLRRAAKSYPRDGLPRPQRNKLPVTVEKSDKAVHGMCPVASESTVCCNLRTIDAVENCAFGCSYCTIQTFYSTSFAFDADFAQKLKSIPIEPDRFYHFGTGQSSDSLVWGNRNGILDALCEFAASHPNVLLEFKTKSDNVKYFLDNDFPGNIVCSWSLNTPTIIRNEEHFTATLEQRLDAARRLADRGGKVAFHFHPMVYYDNWETDYPEIAAQLLQRFTPAEVLFISFGSVTFIKPVIKKIRALGQATKILQMELVSDPHGKLTYPDDLKVMMFRRMYAALQPWHERIFFYLCMEKAKIWQETFGSVYPDNETFERDFGRHTMKKLTP